MIPLIFASIGQQATIKKIGGSTEIKKHLETLGFVAEESVTVINQIAGNIIVHVKESRIALSREMAQKIMVEIP